MTATNSIYIDPSYSSYYRDRLFDLSDAVLNRDNCLLPFARMRESLNARGFAVHTADMLIGEPPSGVVSEYYSLGILDNYTKFVGRSDVRLAGFLIMEPPVVAPRLYRALPDLTRHFERVYVHNIEGDGYSLKGVDRTRLRTFKWPQPNSSVLEPYWSAVERKNRVVVINGNHIPRSLNGELYSKRISAMAHLARLVNVDLYGHGWDKWWSHRSMWPPYWFNYRTLMSIYRGACASKYEVLSQYRFSLCFENMTMTGYVTEKIFDCLYAGCVPLYLGAKNIEELIPSDVYVDCRQFSSWEALNAYVVAMPDSQVEAKRQAGRAFLESPIYLKYINSIIDIVSEK
jgi:hypothetical protein